MSVVLPNSGPGKIDHSRNCAKSHDEHFGSAVLSFPETLGRQRLPVFDQEDTDFCTSYGEATSNGYEKGQLFSPEWQTAAEGDYLGAPITNGADPYPSMEATAIMGSLPAGLSPFSLSDKGADFISDWSNWPSSLAEVASSYKASLIPYYVDGPYDVFDNVRNALYQAFLANEKGVVKAFGFWYESWNQEQSNKGVLQCPAANEQPISRHRYSFIDFVVISGTPYLVAALTQGNSFGDNGFLYFDRQTVNFAFANSIQEGLGLYINRPPQDVWALAVQWFTGILAFLTSKSRSFAPS